MGSWRTVQIARTELSELCANTVTLTSCRPRSSPSSRSGEAHAIGARPSIAQEVRPPLVRQLIVAVRAVVGPIGVAVSASRGACGFRK